jgi:hypothetical protein
MLAERDQEAIDFYPVATRQDGLKRRRRLYRRSRVNVTPAIGDTVNMDIPGNVGLATRNAEHEVGTFRTNTVERLRLPTVGSHPDAYRLQRLGDRGLSKRRVRCTHHSTGVR